MQPSATEAVSMPVLNGIDAVNKLRESGSRAKFVFLTIHSDNEFVDTHVGRFGIRRPTQTMR